MESNIRDTIDVQIKIFKFEDGQVKLTEHCELIPFLKRIKTHFKKDYMKVYSYLAYCCHESPANPYFNYSLYDREFKILEDLECTFDIEHNLILHAKTRLNEMYQMPSSLAYTLISETLSRIASECINSASLTLDPPAVKSIMDTAKSFRDLKKQFDESRKDLMIENETTPGPRNRGNITSAYDG